MSDLTARNRAARKRQIAAADTAAAVAATPPRPPVVFRPVPKTSRFWRES